MNIVPAIIRIVESHYSLPPGTVLSRSLLRPHALARAVAMAIACECGQGLSEAGHNFNRTHGAIFHAKRMVKNDLDTIPQFRPNYHKMLLQVLREIPAQQG